VNDEIRLLVRADDMGSTYASNLGCIECYRNGIVRSVEVMVPCSWFEHACRLLKEHPGLDVGVHMVLTSEWTDYKWRPLTHCPGITDRAGYFLPMVSPREGFAEDRTLMHANWRIEEVEAELRAQIELALARLPRISHLTGHMGWENSHEQFAALLEKLERSYSLERCNATEQVRLMPGYDKWEPPEGQIASFVDELRKLTPGTWLFVEHPALDHPEMDGIRHVGSECVRGERSNVTRILTSPATLSTIAELGIELISYREWYAPPAPRAANAPH
jgi:predicted glycoside hydrolase/deacetylase ChbG (UPF0249 family)